jgi:hypothetical protein
VNCSLARQLLDDCLGNALATGDRRRLDEHLASCPACVSELHRRSALDRTLQQAIGASGQHWDLPAHVSTRMIREAQVILRRSVRLNHARSIAQGVASLAALALVLIGLSVVVGRLPLPSSLNPVALLPARQLALMGWRPATIKPEEPLDSMLAQPVPPSPNNQTALSLISDKSLIEPQPMFPGEPFTMTLLLHSSLPMPLETARFDLEISGPTGYFRFPLTVDGPVPAGGISLLRVTPGVLESLCQQKYLMSPAALFNAPGVYRLRVTLFSPVVKPEP